MHHKKAEHEFGYDHEWNEYPGRWRQGEGLDKNLKAIAGDPKALREKLKMSGNKYIEKIAEWQKEATVGTVVTKRVTGSRIPKKSGATQLSGYTAVTRRDAKNRGVTYDKQTNLFPRQGEVKGRGPDYGQSKIQKQVAGKELKQIEKRKKKSGVKGGYDY